MGHREALVIEDRDQLLRARPRPADARMKKMPASPPATVPDVSTDLDDNDQEVVVPKVQFSRPAPPTFSDVGTNAASFSWSAVDLAEYEPPQEDGKLPVYSIEYFLEYQEGTCENGTSHGNGTQSHGKTPRSRGEAWRVAYRGTAMQHQVTTLRPGRSYVFQLRCVPHVELDNVELVPTPPSTPVELATVPTPPHELQPPSLSNRARNALKLKWNPPEETGGLPILLYTLFMKPAPPGHTGIPDCDGFVVVYSGEERNFRIPGLRPGMRFTFRVQAANKLGSSPHSLCSVFTTQASVPGVITALHEVARTESSVAFQWAPPEDNGAAISGYVVELDDGAGDGFRLAYAGPAPACTISALRSGLPYRFRARADNDEGRGNWSTPQTASTAATTPASPGAPTLIGANRTSVSLSWTAPEDDGGSMVELYELDLLPKSAVATQQLGREWLTVFRGPSCGATASNLLPGCAYMARCRAINAAGPGPYSAAVEVHAAPDSPYAPPAPEATAATSHSLTISWKAPPHDGGSAVTSYRLEAALTHPPESELHPSAAYDPHHTSVTNFRCVYTGPEREAVVEDLPPGAHYLLRVAALNSQGGSPWSPEALVATRPAAPLAPPAVAVTAATSSSVALQWQAPDCQGAAVTGYQVEAAALEARCQSPGPCQEAAAGDDAAASTCSSSGAKASARYTMVYRGPALQCEAKGLEAHQEYCFRVRAINAVSAGAWSAEARATTQPAAPTPPLGLHVTGATSTTVTLAWSPPAADHGSPLTAYHLELSHPPSRAAPKPSAPAPTWQRAYAGPDPTTTITALKPGRAYTFRVRALNARGASPPSDPAAAATLPAPPGAPAPPTLAQRTATSLRARWAFPEADNGAPVEYCVLELAGVDGAFRAVYRGPETAFKVQGLQPVTHYSLRVAAVNAAGQGPWSAEATGGTTTLPPPPPQDVDVGVAEAGGEGVTMTVRWDPPVAAPRCARVLMYEVEAAEAEGGEGRAWRQMGGHEGECTVAGLPTGVAVAVRMRAVGVDGAGHSAWTPAVKVVTPGQRAAAAAEEAEEGAAGALAVARKRGGKAAKAAGAKAKARALPHPRASDSDDASSTTSSHLAAAPRKGGAAAKAKPTAGKLPPKRKPLVAARTLQAAKRFLVSATLGALLVFVMWLAWEESKNRPTAAPFVPGQQPFSMDD